MQWAGRYRPNLFWEALARRPTELFAASITLLSIVVFGSGLHAQFVSDSWIFLQRAADSPQALLRTLAPSNDAFYRPVIELAFWIERRLFGLDPAPFHLTALGGHMLASAFVGGISYQLTRSKVAALATFAAFLFTIHAHEVVFDIADLHNALGGPVLFGAILLFLRGHRYLPVFLTALLFLIDESGLLVLPLAVLCQLVRRPRLSLEVVRELAPLAIATVVYVGWRMSAGGFGNEVADQCSTIGCITRGAGQYFNRLFLRPDALVSKEAPTFLIAAVVVGLALLLQPRRWGQTRAVIFGFGWMVGTSLFFILALWPYVADRFIYIPSAGVAVMVGAFVAESVQRGKEGFRAAARGGIVVVVLAIWVAAGALTLNARGAVWTAAGVRASWIIDQIVALHPNPPEGATLSFRGVPAVYLPFIPPGSTGAFLFHNGLPAALAIAYDRNDLTVTKALPLQSPDVEAHIIRLAIFTSGVVAEDPDFAK